MEPNPKYGNQDKEMSEYEFIELFLNCEQKEIKPENNKLNQVGSFKNIIATIFKIIALVLGVIPIILAIPSVIMYFIGEEFEVIDSNDALGNRMKNF